MPTLTINITGRGTPVANDGTGNPGASVLGHMWYSLDDGNGSKRSYGFAPIKHGDPWGPGKVYNNDDSNYLSSDYSVTVEITTEQFIALENFGKDPGAYGFDLEYQGISNSCIDFEEFRGQCTYLIS